MKQKYLSYLFAALLTVSLTGCRADLDKVDTTAGLNMALSMPVGQFSIAMSDLLGENAPNLIVDENGLFHILDTAKMPSRQFHPINLANYVVLTEGGKHFKVLEQISSKVNPLWLSYGYIESPIDTVIPLTFSMSMKLQGFNESIDSERIDSILVALASFMSTVDHSADFGITWQNIDGITLKLGNRLIRHNVAQNDVVIPISSYDFGSQIPININDFTINLIDPNDPIGLTDSVMLEVQFDLKLIAEQPVSITAESDFVYDLRINLLDYDAVWGYFKESREMEDEDCIAMDSLWNNWSEVQKMKMKFARPSLTFHMMHHIAAPLKARIDYMYSYTNATSHREDATWGGSPTTDIPISPILNPQVSTNLNDSVEVQLRFSYLPEEGQIDRLFYSVPDSFHYQYHVMIDEGRKMECPQHRLTSRLDFSAYQVLDLPFYFEKGTSFTCTQEMEGLKLSKLQLDSLLQDSKLQVKSEKNDLTLYLAAENYIPFEVDVYMECLDKDNNPVDVSFFEGDTLRIPAPAAADIVDGSATKPSHTVSLRTLHKNEFEKMSKVVKFRLVASMGKNDSPAKLTTDTKLTMKIGITAELEGTINFDKLFKE